MKLQQLIAGFLTATSLITPVLAVPGTVDADSGLRMREGAGTDCAVVATIPDGAQVEILTDAGSGWTEIAYQGTKGYVAAEYLKAAPSTGKVTEGPLNVRSGPGTGSDRVGRLATGDAVEILATQDGWYQIKSGDLTGYVSADYVTLAGAAPAEAPASEGSYIRVLEGPLNVRSGPGTGYEQVSRLATGSVVEALGLENGWYQIETGYVCADYVRTADPSEAAGSAKGQEIAQYALGFVGHKYVYGGASPKGFDCSGLTYYVYKQFGYDLNRGASSQLKNGVKVSMAELQPGDLVMFKKKGSGSGAASHVGIYIGGGQFVHASAPGVGVIVSDMDSAYYTTGFVGGRRIV